MKKRGKKARSLIENFAGISDRTTVILFLTFVVAALFIFDSIADQKAKAQTPEKQIMPRLDREAVKEASSKFIISDKAQDGVGFIIKDTVDPELLGHLAAMDYEQIKQNLGLQEDFVIYFEDENGQVAPISGKWCIGSKSASVSGIQCS